MTRLRPHVLPLLNVSFDTCVAALFDDPWFIGINSIRGKTPDGRYSIVAVSPAHTFSLAGGFVTIDGHTTIDTPISALARFCDMAGELGFDPYLPISGGAIGYIGFEGAKALAGFGPARGFSRFPQCRFGIYKTIICFDHIENTSWLIASEDELGDANRLRMRLQNSPRRIQNDDVETASMENCRLIPEDASFAKLTSAAYSWVRSGNLARIHIARHRENPQSSASPVDAFFSKKHVGKTTYISTHEGAAFILGSDDLLLHILEDDVESRIFSIDQGMIDARMEEMLRVCADVSLDLSDCKSSVAFRGIRRPEMKLVYGLAGLLPALSHIGHSRHTAMKYIDEHEKTHRQFYGGAFGFIHPRGLSFQTIQEATTFADGAVRQTIGADLTSDVHPSDLVMSWPGDPAQKTRDMAIW